MRKIGMKKIFFLFFVGLLSLSSADIKGQDMEKQYIYVLKLIPELYEPSSWTEKENKIVQEHFDSLKAMHNDGSLILAGRTLNTDAEGMGIVIFTAGSDEEAEKIAKEDPAVKAGIMTAKVFPYRVALIKKFDKEEE